MVNFYEILSIKNNATQNQIKDAFKKAAKLFHPDKNLNNPQSEEKFKAINEAYQILSNIQKKEIYDQKLTYFLNSKKPKIPPVYYQQSTTEQSKPKETYKPEDYSTQGKHYANTYYDHSRRSTLNYVIAFVLVIIIAVIALLFGLMMNNIAAQEHYKAALLHYETEDYPNAVKELDKALEFDSKLAEAFQLRGDIHFQFEKYELALPDFNLALKYSHNTNNMLVIKRNTCRQKIAEKLVEKNSQN